MNPNEMASLLDRFRATQKRSAAFSAAINLTKLCFGKQLAFINDPSLFVTAVTSRRAGKTTACALHLLHTALTKPKTTSFYITYARTDAKGIVWPILHDLNRELSLHGQPNEADLTWKFPNGSIIRLGGAATKEEINRFRGYGVALAYVDECQRFSWYLQQLVDDVLTWACAEYRGQIRLIGTPGLVPVGYFHDVAETSQYGATWSKHHWTMFDNPWIEIKRGESPQAILDQELNRRQVGLDDPTIQREFFGRWVIDKKRLVLDYDSSRNHYIDLPQHNLQYIMGIDLGYKDADAICILGHSDRSPITYLVDEIVTTKQGLTELFHQVEDLRKLYNPYKIVIDTGGLGLKIAESMRQRYRIPVHAAEKTRKFENIELFNDAMRTSKFMAKKTSRFAADAILLEWDLDKETPDKKVISDRFHSDIIDAALYAFRESPAYNYVPPKIPSKPGSPQWAREEEQEMERQTIERLEKQFLTSDPSLEFL